MSFFVTAIAYYPDDPLKRYDQPYKCVHTFGHFANLTDVQSAVDRNDGGMDECLYNYLVIEEIGYGIHAGILNDNEEKQCQWWYEWQHPDGQEGRWVLMDTPKWSLEFYCWAMG